MNIDIGLKAVLVSIDDFFDEETLNIVNNLNSLGSYSSDIFDGKQFNVSKIYMIGGNRPGLYIFRINSQMPIQVNKFDAVDNAPKLNQKNHRILGIKKSDDFKNLEILYLGKSEENVYKRLIEHISNPKSKSTYALRLGHQNRNMLNGKLDLFVFELKEEYREFAKTILSSIESRLHDKLYPRVGSKR